MNAEEILEALRKKGIVTEEHLMELDGVGEEARNVINVLESLYGDDDTHVIYAKEAQMPETWKAPAHRRWIRAASKLAQALDVRIESLPEALGDVIKANDLLGRSKPKAFMLYGLHYRQAFTAWLTAVGSEPPSGASGGAKSQ